MTLTSDVFNEGAPRFHRWCEVAALIVAVHLGSGVLASVQWPEPEADPEPTGAVVMELLRLPLRHSNLRTWRSDRSWKSPCLPRCR